MRRSNIQRIGTIAIIVVVSFSLGFFASRKFPQGTYALHTPVASSDPSVNGISSTPPADIHPPVDFNQFWELWRELKSRYHKQPVDDATLFYGAMSGMASSLGDPYTTYFEPKTAGEFSDALQGHFSGIGAEIGIRENQLQVIAPLPETPADKIGIRAGDMILSIDKQDTSDMSVDKAVSLIRGNKGTVVTLLIGRVKIEKDAKGKEHKTLDTKEYAIVRDQIVVKSVTTKELRDGVLQITISSFNQDTQPLFQSVINGIKAKKPKAIILDLRNDPGGYLDAAVFVASAWVGENVVVMERQQDKITQQLRGQPGGALQNIPTIVLVNQGSASASEIVAGALQDYGSAKLVGMKTFGKGSVQDYSEFPDKSAIKITIAEWLTPKQRSIQKIGIQPDIQVDLTIEDSHANRDPQLTKALEILTGKAESKTVRKSTTPTTAK